MSAGDVFVELVLGLELAAAAIVSAAECLLRDDIDKRVDNLPKSQDDLLLVGLCYILL